MRLIKWNEKYYDEAVCLILEIWNNFTWTSSYEEGYQKAGIFLKQCLNGTTYARILIDKGHVIGIIMAYSEYDQRSKEKIGTNNEISESSITPAIAQFRRSNERYQRLCESLMNDVSDDLNGEIKLLAIKPSYQRKGLGKKLLVKAITYLRKTGCKKFYLFTDSNCNYIFYQIIGLQCISYNTIDNKRQEHGFKVYLFIGDTSTYAMTRQVRNKIHFKSFFIRVNLIPTIVLLLLIIFAGKYSVEAFSSKVYCKDTLKPMKISEVKYADDANDNTEKTIVLDAGHGGYDGGSTVNGIVEKDITLAIVQKLGERLKQDHIQVIYTREDDNWYWNDIQDDLQQRITISEQASPNLFMSIHLNEYLGDSKGVETWVSFSDDASFALASIVQNELSNLQYSDDRGLKNQDDNSLFVLSNNTAPSVLIELGFISNMDDINYITNDETQNLVIDALANSINKYLNR